MHLNSLSRACQSIPRIFLRFLWGGGLLLAAFGPARGEEPAPLVVSSAPALGAPGVTGEPVPPPQSIGSGPGRRGTVAGFLDRIARMHVGGSLSLNWRNVGPRRPGFETQIQNEVYLADMYFGVDGPFVDQIPFNMEWHMPTGSQGQIRLNQLNFAYERLDGFKFQFGKFLVPFGRYNELYKPDQYLTVTRPLLYAAPDSLDLVVRPNSPRPPLSAGYTDIGARVSWYPPSRLALVPSEATVFVVNGLGETSNRQRTFPDPENLGIQGIPTNGLTVDFGHRNNNLADNNNAKTLGGRLVFGSEEVRAPWPFPEDVDDVKGVSVGLSGMGGRYDLEGYLDYFLYGLDFSLDYMGMNFSGEYMYSFNHFLSPLGTSPVALAAPVQHVRSREIIHGYFLQTSVPLLRDPGIGKRVTGIFVFNQAYRRGPQLDLFLNFNDGKTIFPSLLAFNSRAPLVTRSIDKYTGALNWQLTDHFFLKFDYSYWTMGKATIRSDTSLGLVDIYQTAFSMVMSF